jgi:heme A synthase
MTDKGTILYKVGLTLCVATFFLIVWGGHVNTTKSGMAFPDWPTSNTAPMVTYAPSQWLMEGDKFWEHGHRLFASVVGLLTTIVMVIAYRAVPRGRRPNMLIGGFLAMILATIVTAIFGVHNMPSGFMETFMVILAASTVAFLVMGARRRNAERILWLAMGAFALVCLQGAFGGYTVRNNLPDWTSTTHGMLAEIFLMVVIGITFLAKKTEGQRPKTEVPRSLRTLVSAAWGLTFVQFFLGALTRHTDAWAVSATFPQWSTEGFFPAAHLFQYGQVLIHFTHRTAAYVVAAVMIWQWIGVLRATTRGVELPSSLRNLTAIGAALVIVQILLGAAIVWTSRGELVTTLHVMVGAGLLVLNTMVLYTVASVNGHRAEAPSKGMVGQGRML